LFEFPKKYQGESRHRYKRSLTVGHRRLKTSADDYDRDEFCWMKILLHASELGKYR
jgi:hypothetical protein